MSNIVGELRFVSPAQLPIFPTISLSSAQNVFVGTEELPGDYFNTTEVSDNNLSELSSFVNTTLLGVGACSINVATNFALIVPAAISGNSQTPSAAASLFAPIGLTEDETHITAATKIAAAFVTSVLSITMTAIVTIPSPTGPVPTLPILIGADPSLLL